MIFQMQYNTQMVESYRRKWRKDGRYTVRVTCTGKISVIRMPLHKDMKTEEQLRCRARFVKAQQRMLEALKDKQQLQHFRTKQRRQGYKTLRGCMMAHFMQEIISEETHLMRETLGIKMAETLSPVMTNIPTNKPVATTQQTQTTHTSIPETAQPTPQTLQNATKNNTPQSPLNTSKPPKPT